MVSYLSVCSGIEAASVAWHPLGWRPLAFSEIEPFPRAVLQHHYPDVPLHGDFTVLRDQPWIADADVLVGGTPCQAFSVAGLRNSLADERGNLSMEFVRLADAIDNHRRVAGKDSAIIVWENVPGVLSVKDNAFGCFLSALAGESAPLVPPRGKWTNAGVVDGPQRQVAWRVLDAQYFGLAQRRRRVFVVASARAGFDPAAVLLEFEGVRRDTPPRREAGQIAPTIPSRSTAGGGLGTDFDCDGGVIRAVAMEDPVPPLMARSSRGRAQTLSPGHQTDGHMVAVEQPYTVANCLTARMHKGINSTLDEGQTPVVTHSLRAEGFDASEDRTGRGTPLAPTTYSIMPQNSGKDYKAREVEVAQPIMAGGPVGGNQGGDYILQPVAFSAKDHGADATLDLSPTLRAMPHNASHANGGGQMAVAIPVQEVGKRTGTSTTDPRAGIGIGEDGDPMFTLQAGAQHGVAVEPYTLAIRGRGDSHQREYRQDGTANAILTPNGGRAGIGVGAVAHAQSGETGKGDAAPCVATAYYSSGGIVRETEIMPTIDSARESRGTNQQRFLMQHMAVRRLTPVECERLQGFPDAYTLIPWKKKPADQCPDGPRYKALGNSMAVPVMRWIGKRIANAIA